MGSRPKTRVSIICFVRTNSLLDLFFLHKGRFDLIVRLYGKAFDSEVAYDRSYSQVP